MLLDLKLPRKMAACTIRQSRESDWVQLEEIYQEQDGEFLPMNTFGEFCREIRQPGYFVAEKDGEVVGGGGLIMSPENGWAGFHFGLVRKSRQKQGIGTALFYGRISTLPDIKDGWRLSLGATPFSRPIYEKFGFFWLNKFWNKEAKSEIYGMLSRTKPGQLPAIKKALKKSGVEVSGEPRIKPAQDPVTEKNELKTKSIAWVTEPIHIADRRFLRQTLAWILCFKLFSAIGILLPSGIWLGLLLIYPYKFIPLSFILLLIFVFLSGVAILAIGYLGPPLYRDFRRAFLKARDLVQVLRSGEKRCYRVSIKSYVKGVTVDKMESLCYILETQQNEVLMIAPDDLEDLGDPPASELKISHFLTEEGKLVAERLEHRGEPKKPRGIMRMFSYPVDYLPKHLTLLDMSLDDYMKNRR